MTKPTCTFSYGGLRHTMCKSGFFHSYLKETKKINNQFLNESQFTLNVYYFTSIERNNIAPFITCALNKTSH